MANTRGLAQQRTYRGSQSAPLLTADKARRLHHRGENAFGAVNGFEHIDEELYVPRASWTSSAEFPLKNSTQAKGIDLDHIKHFTQQEGEARRTMTNYLRRNLAGQVKDREARRREQKAAEDALPLKNDNSRELREAENLRRTREAFRSGLEQQMDVCALKARDALLQEAREAAEIKLRSTQQLCEEMAAAKQRKDNQKRAWMGMRAESDAMKKQMEADRKREQEELRRKMGEYFEDESVRIEAQARRMKKARASQEACYERYEQTQGKALAEKAAEEQSRQTRDEKQHLARMDMMYAQRELARERQKHRMREDLDRQLRSKLDGAEDTSAVKAQEQKALSQAFLQHRETEAAKAQAKRTAELRNQADLIDQMQRKQQQHKEENPYSRIPPAVATMQVSESLLATAKASRGLASTKDAINQQMDAPLHVSKPFGRPEIKPWVDIELNPGPGGLVGVFAGDGPTRSYMMTTGGTGRLLTRTKEIEMRDRELNRKKNWHQGLNNSDIRRGQEAAAKRVELNHLDKSMA